jgi:hypothetical protein
MNWYVITGIVILGIILGIFIFAPVHMKQNGNPEMAINTSPLQVSHPVPGEPVIASFGLDENNPERTVFLKNPVLMDAFINASEADIGPYYYPKGPVLGYG